jgi:2-polyprenyl-3-methyl-5-hydroxy-6-metoxy-1,4-benzoquinol methylase
VTRPCDLCGCARSAFLLEKNGASYRTCSDCEFVFTDCSETEWEQWNTDAFERMRADYVERSYTAAKQRRYDRRLAGLKPWFGAGRLLEIGANVGGFLYAARRAGWTVTGVEPVEACARFAREQHELDVLPATLERADLEPASFDLIYSNAVFEHLWSPTRTLAAAVRLLRPGGVVFLDTVNWDSYTRERLGARWKLVDPRVHACLYTPTTLRALCERSGLEVVRTRSHRVHLRPNDAPALTGVARRMEELRKLPWSLGARLFSKGESLAVLARATAACGRA